MLVSFVDEIAGDLKYCRYGHIKKNEHNYGFKQKYLMKYSKRFNLQHSNVLPQKNHDLIVGPEASESDSIKRNYRTGYNIHALNAFDEIMSGIDKEIGRKINISKDLTVYETEVIYEYLKQYQIKHHENLQHSKQG